MGNGGDINIDAENIVILENSQINANAFEGVGGNINITTEGLFRSDDNAITASSALGVAGVVTINCKRQHSGTESCAPAKRRATWKAEHSGTENALMLKQRPYGGTELYHFSCMNAISAKCGEVWEVWEEGGEEKY